MSQKVNAVPDPSFSVPPLTTVAGSRVSRRRVKIPSNNISAVYTPSNVSSGSSSIVFDIADNESFLDMDKSMLSFDFTPFFIAGSQVSPIDNTQSRLYPIHPIGFDGSSQSLLATVRIGNSQGLIIEEIQAYATFSHIMESYTQSENQQENSLYDLETNALQIANRGNVRGAPESSKLLHSHVKRKMFLKFKNSSFLKSCRMIPLFLMRNGIRIQVDLQDSYKLFTRKMKPDWQGPAFAHKYPNSLIGGAEANLGAGTDATSRALLYSLDWHMVRAQGSNAMGMVVKKESRLAQILNLRQLAGIAQYYFDRNTSGVTASAANKHTHNLILPLKIVYTDEFGVDKIWYQGVFSIRRGIWYRYAAAATNFIPVLADATDLQQAFVSSETISIGTAATGTATSAISLGREEVYFLDTLPQIDGFSEIFASQQSDPFNTANFIPFLPYARFQPRVYADVNDVNVYVPSGTFFAFRNYSEADYSSAVTATTSTGLNSVNNTDTFGGQLRYANRAVFDSAVSWSYYVQNAEMLCDFVKPSSEVFLQFQQAFQAPAGIPYAFKRILYKTAILQPTEGFVQVPLPVSVRSLRGVLVVLSDPYANASGPDNTRKHFPAISSLMKRGLSRAQLVIGGQNYPSYDLNLTELGLEQIPELECLFNVSGLGGFNPSFDLTELLSSTNYAIGLGKVNNVAPFAGQWTDVVSTAAGGNMGIQEYHDTSKFVLGLSTMKKDGDFVTGVDTSQSGSVYLNLQFRLNKDVTNGYQGDFGGRSGRQIFMQCFAICDAVFTLQNDANLVRY